MVKFEDLTTTASDHYTEEEVIQDVLVDYISYLVKERTVHQDGTKTLWIGPVRNPRESKEFDTISDSGEYMDLDGTWRSMYWFPNNTLIEIINKLKKIKVDWYEQEDCQG